VSAKIGKAALEPRPHLRVQVLPAIIFVSALFAILYYLGVMQLVVKGLRDRHEQGHGGERRGEPERRASIFMVRRKRRSRSSLPAGR